MEPDCDTKQLIILPVSVSLLVGGLTDDRPEASLAVCGSALKGQRSTPTTSSESLKHLLPNKDSNITEDSAVNVAVHIKVFFIVYICAKHCFIQGWNN